MNLISLTAFIACLGAVGSQAKDDPVLVTCGSLVKLENEKTRHMLHSHEVSYGGGRGSGQQSVTGYPEKDSSESFWIIRAADGHCTQGTPITNGQAIKLQHATTRRWLHSHQYFSPLSNQQEVSCFGTDGQSDAADEWIIEWDDKAKHWTRDGAVRFKHKVTASYLSNHAQQYQRPIPGHTEVYASKNTGPTATFRATEGVYFPENKEA